MAGRQSAPNPGHRLAACAAILLTRAGHAGPAAASANTPEMCDDAGQRSFEITGSEVPEPTTLALFGIGLAGFAARKLRRKK